MSIRLRLTLWYSAVLGVTAVAFCIAVYLLVSVILYQGEKQDMRLLAQQIYNEINLRIGWNLFLGPLLVPDFPELNEFRYSGYFLQLVDERGRVRQKNIVQGQLPVPTEVPASAVFQEQRIGQTNLLIFNVPIMLYRESDKTTQLAGLLQVATIIDDIERTLANLRTALTLVALTSVALASTLGWFLARKALQPIELIIGAAERIGQAEDLNNRIEYGGPQDEIGRLTGTINSMLSRIQLAYGELEEAVRAQRRFVSDASHELRTPLTTIRGNAELLEKIWNRWQEEGVLREVDAEQSAIALDAVRDIAGEAERMSRLVGDLLMLARADAGHKMQKSEVALRPLVEEVIRKAQHLPRTADWVQGDLDPLRDAVVFGNADALRQLLFIFIENAFKYTPDGEVELGALSSADGGAVGIRIRDTGIGMDKADVPQIFERFYRADVSRGETSGTGLGLAIARWIIDEHEGSVEVMTREGEGSSFIIWLPTARGTGRSSAAAPDAAERSGLKYNGSNERE